MRAIIIQDTDAQALLEQLELNRLTNAIGWRSMQTMDVSDSTRKVLVDEVHRSFHYIVCRWLQEQGAHVVRS